MTTDDRTTPPPPDAAAHVEAIRNALNRFPKLIILGTDAEATYSDLAEDVARHVAALDAARIAAEQQLAAEQERVARLQAAFIKAENRVELWEANQDQTYEIWIQRWGLHPYDLHSDPAARRDRDARGGEA